MSSRSLYPRWRGTQRAGRSEQELSNLQVAWCSQHRWLEMSDGKNGSRHIHDSTRLDSARLDSTRLYWCERFLQYIIETNILLTGESCGVKTLCDLTRLDSFGVNTALVYRWSFFSSSQYLNCKGIILCVHVCYFTDYVYFSSAIPVKASIFLILFL